MGGTATDEDRKDVEALNTEEETEDTVALAIQDREKEGPWEVEISYGGEADLHKHRVRCVKNPGHHNFIPVDEFNIDHLPPGYQDQDVLDYVRAMSDLTVRVSVKYVSEHRPPTILGKAYTGYKDRRSRTTRVGTGWIGRVNIYPRDDASTCPCYECQNSPTPKTQWAKLTMQTAAHVVFDLLESAITTCHLFYDNRSSPDACSEAVALYGWYVEWQRSGLDVCLMCYVTHDVDLADKLDKMIIRLTNLSKIVVDKFSGHTSSTECEVDKFSGHTSSTECEVDKFSGHTSSTECEVDKFSGHTSSTKDEVDKFSGHTSSTKCEVDKFSGHTSSTKGEVPATEDNLTIIVSHPHGCSKQVSVGWRKEKELGLRSPRCKYTTATCPGSSGAYVGRFVRLYTNVYYYFPTHSGGDKHSNFCYSSDD